MQLSVICVSSGPVRICLVDISVGGFFPRAVNCFQVQGFMGKALWLNSYLFWLGSLASHRKDVNVDFLPLGFDVKRKGQRTENVKGSV